MDQADMITTGDAARMLGWSETYIRQLCTAGKLDFMQTPRGRIVSRASVAALLMQRDKLAKQEA